MKRQAWKKRRGKKGRQLHGKGGRDGGMETVGWVRGGLQAERHVNGERRASLTRSLARHFLLTERLVQLLLCVSLPSPTAHTPSQALLQLFSFLLFLWLAEIHCYS